MPRLRRRERACRLAWGMIAAALILIAAGDARAAAVSCPVNEKELFSSFRDKFLADSKHPAPVATQAVTRFLTTGSEARLVYRATASEDKKPLQFRIIETDRFNKDSLKSLGERAVLSVAPVPENLVDGFQPADGTLVRFLLPGRHGDLIWRPRNFVIVRCVDGNIHDWGVLRAPVSSVWTMLAICAVVLGSAYVLAMIAVRRVRNEAHPLAAKYPAYRVSRPITLRDFINPIHLMADAFHRGSVQKLQVILFSFLVGGLLLSLVLRSGILVGFSATILGLLGISGIGAVVGQGSATFRNRMGFENWAWLVKKRVLPINEMSGAVPRWRDLVTTNREFDIYKLQTLIFSVAVALALLVAGASSLSSFRVPEELLGILALSQGIFVAGVLVRPPAVEDLDKALTSLRKAEEIARLAVLHGVDIEADGELKRPLPPPPAGVAFSVRQEAAKRALQNYKELADRVEVMIETTLETEVDRRRLDPDIRPNRRTLGPDGGPGGIAFSIDPADDETEIHSLSVWSGTVIDAIQATYRHRSTGAQTVGPKIGGPGGGLNQVVLQPGERLLRVGGRVGACVDSLWVQTSAGRREPPGTGRWGGEGGNRDFDFVCDAGEEVIGFEGRSGEYINALGVVVRPGR